MQEMFSVNLFLFHMKLVLNMNFLCYHFALSAQHTPSIETLFPVDKLILLFFLSSKISGDKQS